MKEFSKTQFVKDLVPGVHVSSPFGVLRKSLARYSSSSSRSGESYIKLSLCDRTGAIEGRVWDRALKVYPSFDVDDVVYVEGQVVDFDGPQVNIVRLEKVAPSRRDLSLYRPAAGKEPEELWQKVRVAIETIRAPELRDLLSAFFDDADFGDAFKTAPGGRSVHHAYSGGLLEHTLEVLQVAETIFEIHGNLLNRDLLVCGCLLHDIGKVLEYDLSSLTFKLTDEGKLLGHVVMGKTLLDDRLRLLPRFSPRLSLHLSHIILSHHGQKEWGSPEVPKTMEAFAVFYSDLVSAKANQFASLIRAHPAGEGSWTVYDRLLERSALVDRLEEVTG